jgi:hypothetical protein
MDNFGSKLILNHPSLIHIPRKNQTKQMLAATEKEIRSTIGHL